MPKSTTDQVPNSSATTDRLLKVIIALLLKGKDAETPSLRRQVEILSDLGMRPVEIAETLGKTPTYVNKELAGIRKGRS